MENTLENKAKFFAQYLFQDVLVKQDGHNWKETLGHWACTISGVQDHHLQLKPLSAISDEDFNKIVEIKESHNLPGTMIKGSLSHKFFIQPQIDYLRGKGYLLPFNGLSEEELLNRGWAVLEQEA